MKLKTIFILLSLVLGSIFAHGADEWVTNFEDALKTAQADNKTVLVNFTGSDWCGWCIRLDKEVFSQAAFKQFATDELVLVKIDFPRKGNQSEALKAQNEALAEKHVIRGFPTILLLSPEGELIGKTGYQAGGPETYIDHLKEFIAQ